VTKHNALVSERHCDAHLSDASVGLTRPTNDRIVVVIDRCLNVLASKINDDSMDKWMQSDEVPLSK
jgi:hypothetical protein